MTLEETLQLLKKYGVQHFEDAAIKVTFHVEQSQPEESSVDRTVDIPIDEASLPPDLRTDNITDYDKVLNWSGSPDQDDGSQLPLTGDAPLEGL